MLLFAQNVISVASPQYRHTLSISLFGGLVKWCPYPIDYNPSSIFFASSGYQPPPPYAAQPAPPRPVMQQQQQQQQVIHGTFDQGARFDLNKPVTLPVSESSVH